MAAMLFGLRDVLNRDGQPPITVHVVSTCDEEHGASGARRLVASGLRADAAVVAEPTELSIVYAHKGATRFRITAPGRAAHSSAPERGVNAICCMARCVLALETELARALRARRHPELGSPTVNVGTIHGGSQVNVVPDQCVIEVDRRLVPGESAVSARAEIRRILAASCAGASGRITIEPTQFYPPMDGCRDSAVVELASQACRRVLGRAQLATAAYATNAGFFAQAGIPCVVVGPGSIRQAHTADEYIDLASFRDGIRVYAAIIRDSGVVLR